MTQEIQLELFPKEEPKKGQLAGYIDQMEFARVVDDNWGGVEYVYGTYEECEEYANTKGKWVEKYLDHVAPHVAQGLKYVGIGHDPYAKNIGYDYENKRPLVDDSF